MGFPVNTNNVFHIPVAQEVTFMMLLRAVQNRTHFDLRCLHAMLVSVACSLLRSGHCLNFSSAIAASLILPPDMDRNAELSREFPCAALPLSRRTMRICSAAALMRDRALPLTVHLSLFIGRLLSGVLFLWRPANRIVMPGLIDEGDIEYLVTATNNYVNS